MTAGREKQHGRHQTGTETGQYQWSEGQHSISETDRETRAAPDLHSALGCPRSSGSHRKPRLASSTGAVCLLSLSGFSPKPSASPRIDDYFS